MEITGKIKEIFDTQQFGNNGFRKRDIVITTDEQYPQHLLVEFYQDKTDVLDQFNIGETVTISINLRGREWVNPQGETKYFNSIQGWKINRLENQAQQQTLPPIVTPEQTFEPADDLNEEDQDDFPF